MKRSLDFHFILDILSSIEQTLVPKTHKKCCNVGILEGLMYLPLDSSIAEQGSKEQEIQIRKDSCYKALVGTKVLINYPSRIAIEFVSKWISPQYIKSSWLTIWKYSLYTYNTNNVCKNVITYV
jgi:hypothetical protein